MGKIIILYQTIILHTEDKNSTHKAPYISIERFYSNIADSYEVKEYIPVFGPYSTFPDDILSNLTSSFMGINSFPSFRCLHNNAGFIFSFIEKEKNQYIPVALLTFENIDYNIYKSISYSFDNNLNIEQSENLFVQQNINKKSIAYPRLFLDYRNINTESESFEIKTEFKNYDSKVLTKFEDYACFTRKGRTYVSLKITNNNLLENILDKSYNITYQVSRANEMLYLDAKQVAKDNSKPKYSYEITVANIPEEIQQLELGQLVAINDYSIDIYKEYGYISKLIYQLDNPKNDSITIANYKTKFEDLFTSISAQNEAIKQKIPAYNIAASGFSENGEIEKTTLQTTLDNNNFSFNFSNTNITLDDTGGLVLTNTNQYSNGIYGQVALRGGGIFCSNSVDNNGNRLWTTGITSEGINASMITTGKLDTNLIRIYSGDTLAFQWSGEGLYAYEEKIINGKSSINNQSYIKFNESGLKYVNNGNTQLDLNWKGLFLESLEGRLKLTGKNGLQILDQNNNVLLTFGKKDNNYGLFFTDPDGNVLLQATQGGNLQLIDTLKIGHKQDNNFSGLCGKDTYNDPIINSYIRFWAGAENPVEAPITITENGTLKAETIVIPEGGKIVFKKNGYEDIVLSYENLKEIIK